MKTATIAAIRTNTKMIQTMPMVLPFPVGWADCSRRSSSRLEVRLRPAAQQEDHREHDEHDQDDPDDVHVYPFVRRGSLP
jgi:hypothetical protein